MKIVSKLFEVIDEAKKEGYFLNRLSVNENEIILKLGANKKLTERSK